VKKGMFSLAIRHYIVCHTLTSVRVYNKLIVNSCALFSGVIHFSPCRSKACFFQYTQKLPIMWWLHFLSYQCGFFSSIYPALAGLGPGVPATCPVAHAYYARLMKLPSCPFGESRGNVGSDGLGVCGVCGNRE